MILGLGVPEMLVILAVVLIIFGPKNLPKLGSTLGKTVKNVREGMEEEDEQPSGTSRPQPRISDAEGGTNAAGATSQAPVAFCSRCGSPLAAGDAFCPHCGAPVAAATTSEAAAPTDETAGQAEEPAAEKVSA